ncbi:MAG: NTP transferase domain-containing protein [Chitinophagaceae bacterium]|nr:NTP transferase domain-containing protein [Chitinophagaceae bacterium]
MISQPHKKHAELIKPAQGNFGRNEWAFMGAPCSDIKLLAAEIIGSLSANYKCAYVDAAHSKENEPAILPGRLACGAMTEYADKIDHHQFNFNKSFNPFQFRQLMNDADIVFVNGNHQQAKAQVVVMHSAKEDSLRKKVQQLTNVQLFLLAEGVDDVFEFVKEALPDWKNIPVCKLAEKEKIISFFRQKMEVAKPVLNGLVLAGGKSLRLGNDKGKINWHGKEQRIFMAELLQQFCSEVFISCREDQQQEMDEKFKTIADTFIGLGPYGAILSAFREQPNAAWLVVACDLPLLEETIFRFLIEHRNTASVATAFESPHDGLPEPLIAIWEPKSYAVLLSFLAQGYSCPRKVLINSEATIIKAPLSESLMNVNTMEEFEKVKGILNKNS